MILDTEREVDPQEIIQAHLSVEENSVSKNVFSNRNPAPVLLPIAATGRLSAKADFTQHCDLSPFAAPILLPKDYERL